ncbi:hypothetical protein [Flagellimonas profundi]|uniref:Uncharacterized protein n=1 Tax=Flagellimonas profundi TaxID=2915620 RepID=A0ABS3FD24_9FLAO|nr:hypothetical protein [Allomuricauda profundi]MBO0341054.1 hypothetical protein [Allomuricauda profundi]
MLQRLNNSKPIRIWTEFIKVIFEFEQYYVELECVPKIASSQNRADEAMTVEVRKHNKQYLPCNNAKVLVENKPITDIKCVRTLLYFTDSMTSPDLDAHWNKILSIIGGTTERKIKKIFEESSSSYHDQIICKPNSEESKKVKEAYSNLIDVGIILSIGDKFLPAFVRGNGYGFAHLERRPLITREELTEELTKYELN